MDKYRSHKIVEAAKIKGIEFQQDGSALIGARDAKDNPLAITTHEGYRERFKGDEDNLGYYVRYEDGYESWSPTKAFEEGYTLMRELPKTMLTEEDIEACIAQVRFKKMGEKTTVCQLILKNGFDVIGTSSLVDPANYNQQIGENLAYEKALGEVWMLEGYLLQEKLANES